MFITESEIWAFWMPILIWGLDTLTIVTWLEKHIKNEVIRGVFASLISTVTLPLEFLIIEMFKQPIKYLFHHPFLSVVIFLSIAPLCELIKYIYIKVKNNNGKCNNTSRRN